MTICSMRPDQPPAHAASAVGRPRGSAALAADAVDSSAKQIVEIDPGPRVRGRPSCRRHQEVLSQLSQPLRVAGSGPQRLLQVLGVERARLCNRNSSCAADARQRRAQRAIPLTKLVASANGCSGSTFTVCSSSYRAFAHATAIDAPQPPDEISGQVRKSSARVGRAGVQRALRR